MDQCDDWEPPAEYHQVAMVGGWVADISTADYNELLHLLTTSDSERIWLGEDIYGGEVVLALAQIAAVRQHSECIAARYRLMHADDDED